MSSLLSLVHADQNEGAAGRDTTLAVLQAVGRAVQELLQKYNKSAASPAVGIVSLNGLIHNDEKAAFREIARQLCT